MRDTLPTPGPWTDFGDPNGDIYGTWPDDGEFHDPIIQCDSGVYGPYGADRARILAVPDMHEALQASLCDDPDWRRLAVAALAKAEGRTK